MLKRPPEMPSEKPNKKRKVVSNLLITQFFKAPKSENEIPMNEKPKILETQFSSKAPFKPSPIVESQKTKHENWTQMLTPEEKLTQSKIEHEPDDEFYLNFFRSIFDVLKLYGDILVNHEEIKILDEFENLTEQAKIMYVRLFMRKKAWVDFNNLEYKKITNQLEASQELVGVGLARSSRTAFLCEDVQFTYEFLSSLNKDLLSKLESHLRSLISILNQDDHISQPLPPLEKYFQNPLYMASRKSSLPEVHELSFAITKLAETKPSPKRHFVELVLEQLRYLNDLKSDVIISLKVESIANQTHSPYDSWLSCVIPPEFPAFLRLTDSSISLFTRLHHAFSFYTCENLMQELIVQRMKLLKYADFRCYVLNKTENPSIFMPIYKNRTDAIEMEEAFSLYIVLEKLREHRLPIETNYEVSKGIALIALKRFGVYSYGDVEDSLEIFMKNYTNDRINDWKLEYESLYRWCKVLYLCIEFIERVKDYSLAVIALITILSHSYYQNKRGHWWERLIIITRAHLALKSQSTDLVHLALSDPLLRSGRRITLERQAQRLGIPHTASELFGNEYDSYNHPLFQDITTYAACKNEDGRPLFKTDSGEFLAVEQYALWWYSKDGWKGYHSENLILPSIYAILMWKAIFYDEVPYVFQTPFQSFPLDYKSDEFYIKRKHMFDLALNELENCEDLYFYFVGLYEKYLNTTCAFISWAACESWGKHNLGVIVKGLGKNVLKKICETFAMDFKHHIHGMPDLVLWRGEEVKFSEIKSTNDRLSDHQRFWIKLLSIYGCKIEVCHVIASN
ncbi:unnamed protein product [Blepharisma stoltei]|uniref:Fanconi-associated nuclease n=1 Tax=Blepharisma stoltei TaxID=1481888 RepID=A0AAU9J1R0_9CILI|nr:unnamed protein product [Blepharisma stoltei]